MFGKGSGLVGTTGGLSRIEIRFFKTLPYGGRNLIVISPWARNLWPCLPLCVCQLQGKIDFSKRKTKSKARNFSAFGRKKNPSTRCKIKMLFESPIQFAQKVLLLRIRLQFCNKKNSDKMPTYFCKKKHSSFSFSKQKKILAV